MQDVDYKWFLDNYLELYKKYGDTFLVIKNKTVIGSYNSYAEAVKAMEGREDIGTFIVQKCNGCESAYTNYISSICFMHNWNLGENYATNTKDGFHVGI